jgi:hypothetical protein
MSVSLGANGGTYQYPQENDPAGWGDDATDWASAVSAALSNIGLGASVSADAVVNIISTSKGILVPRMTTTQRNAIGSPSTSLLIYNTTTTQYELYTGSTWQSLASYISGTLTVTGAASLQSTLNVTGSSTFANTTVNGTLSVTGGTTLASITGTSAQLNSLSVTGSTSLSSLSSLTVTGSSSLNTLSVTGNTTLASVTGANVTATGTILAASGSSGSLSVASSGDTDTGMYWSAANELTFSTGGNPRFRIESTGQIKAVYESQVGTDYNTTLDNGYFCRAWVNFNGTTVVNPGTSTGINASGNVSSVTDNGTGNYTVTFMNALPDANYSVITSAIATAVNAPTHTQYSALSAGSFVFYSCDTAGGAVERTSYSVGVFR